MLIDEHLPKSLWAEAVSHAAYIRNRAMMTALTGKSPYEAMFNKKPNISHLHPFGCDVYVLDETRSKSKLDPKAVKQTFVSFEDGPQAIRYYDTTTHQVMISRNYKFLDGQGNGKEMVDLDGISELFEQRERDGGNVEEVKGEEVEAAIEGGMENKPNHSPDESKTQTPESPIQSQATPTTLDPTNRHTALCTRKNLDYKLINNPAAWKPAKRPQQPTDTPPGTEGLEPEVQQEVASFALALLACQSATLGIPQTLTEAQKSPEWT